MPEPSIKTTVVGSYPLPTWLAAYPSVPNLRDAILVVLKTQELAGLDVISDGELTRFDVNHPETNGMIEYFVQPMSGISSEMGRKDVDDFRAQQGMGFRTQPAAVVEGPIGEGELDLPSSWQMVKELTASPLKFTVTAPYMLAKTLLDRVDMQAKRGQFVWAHEPINHVLDGARGERALHLCFGNYGGQSIQSGFWAACSASSTTCTSTTSCWSSPAAAMMSWRFSQTCVRGSPWESASSILRITKWRAPT